MARWVRQLIQKYRYNIFSIILQSIIISSCMLSSGFGFPTEDFLVSLRSNRAHISQFVTQSNSLNTHWIYQIIKHCHNIILDIKQLPSTKLAALETVRDLMETCQIPCIDLIEVYILPIIYEVAIQRPQEHGDKRGSNFFQQHGKSSRIPNIQETGIKFVRMCTEIVYAGSIIKSKRTFGNQQLNQKSQFVDHYQKLQKYGIPNTPSSSSQVKYFSPDFLKGSRQKYLTNLQNFSKDGVGYNEYFVTKVIQSLQTDANPLFSATNATSSVSNELDMRKLLKHGDVYITSPLIQQLLAKLNYSDNLFVKKHCLSLLSDFFKWGDIQAIAKICNHDCIENIGHRIAEVSGPKGSAFEQNIYPEIKGQKDAKRKFYIQYLKSLQVFAKLLDIQKIQIQGSNKIMDLYNYFKKNKFQFPQNLMAKRIQSDFRQNLQHNQQRNMMVMKKLGSQSSLSKNNRKVNNSQMSHNKVQLSQINHNIEQCLEQLLKVPQSQSQIDKRMSKLMKFKQNFDHQVDKIDENTDLKQEEIEQIIDNGLQLTRNIQRLESFYTRYKNKQINFNELAKQHKLIMKDYEDEPSVQMSLKNQTNLHQSKEAADQVISSYIPQVPKQPFFQTSPIQLSPPSHISIRQSEAIRTVGQNNLALYRQQTFGAPSLSTTNNGINLNTLGVSQNGLSLGVNTNYAQGYQKQSANAYQLTTPNFKPAYPQQQSDHINQQQVLHQITSSIMSNKNGKNSKLSNKSQERPSYSKISSGSTLKERMEKKKEEKRNSQIRQSEQPQFILGSGSQPNSVQPIKHQIPHLPEIVQKDPNVEYINYMAPPSFKMPKLAPSGIQSNLSAGPEKNQQIYAMTVPNNTSTKIYNQSQPRTPYSKNTPMLMQQNDRNAQGNQQVNLGNHTEYTQTINSARPLMQVKSIPPTHEAGSQRMSASSQRNDMPAVRTVGNKIITGSGYKGSPTHRAPESRTAGQKQQDQKLYKMYKNQLTSRRRFIEASEHESELSSGGQSAQNFGHIVDTPPVVPNIMPVLMNPNQRPADIAHNSLSSSLSQSSSRNNKNLQAQQQYGMMPRQQMGELVQYNNGSYSKQLGKSSSVHGSTVRPYNINNNNFCSTPAPAPMGTSSNNLTANYASNTTPYRPIAVQMQPNQSRISNYADDDDDVIRQPDIQPLENSYYGAKEIQAHVKNSIKPDFKDIFQIQKQVLPSSIRNPLLGSINDYGIGASSNAISKVSSPPKHEEYLIAKLKRQYERQSETETKSLQNRVLNLKADSSRLRNQIRNKQNNLLSNAPRHKRTNSKQSSQSYSSSVVAFSNSKSNQSYSPLSLRPSQRSHNMGISTVSSMVGEGAQVSQHTYVRFLSDFNDIKLKKSCMRNKSLLFKSESCEIGYTLKRAQDIVKMTVYFTPQYEVGNFAYSIAKQPNLDIQSYCKDISMIPAHKQVKIQISANLKNIPYNLPMMNIRYLTNGQQKNVSFYLPLTFNKFVTVNPVDPVEFERLINQNKKSMIKTPQFKLNNKIVKPNNILQNFPNFTELKPDIRQNTLKYGGRCSFKNHNFLALITTKGKERVMIQSIPENEYLAPQFYMLTLQKLIQQA